jgi:reactive chlorine resistance protein C
MQKLIDALPSPRLGFEVLRWAMVFIFLFFGIAKFAAYEAEALEPIVTIYPLFFWLPPLVGVQGTSNVIGVTELATGLMIALGAWSARAGLIGGAMGTFTFLVTLTFAIGAPLWQPGYGFPFMGSFAQFLFKDAALFGACLTLMLVAAQQLKDRAPR